MTAQETVRINDQILAAINAHDTNKLMSLMAPNATWIDVSTPEPMRDRTVMQQWNEAWFTAFPDLRITAKNVVASEDQVATEVEFTGTNTGPMQFAAGGPAMPATGKKIIGKGMFVAKVRNGKVAEFHSYPDTAGMMTQLGLFAAAA